MSAFSLPGLPNLSCANVYGIGRNYVAHARELGNAVPSGEPIVFLKPVASLLNEPATLRFDPAWGPIDHEAEVVVAMGEGGRIAGLGVGLDLTARDVQMRLKNAGLPWTLAKGKKGFAPVSRFVPYDEKSMPLDRLRVRAWVNGELRQDGETSLLVFSIPRLIEFLDRDCGLQPGDLIYTGTPAGVKALLPGDRIRLEGSFGSRTVGFESRVE